MIAFGWSPLFAAGIDWLEALLPILFVGFWIVSQIVAVIRKIAGPAAPNRPGPAARPVATCGQSSNARSRSFSGSRLPAGPHHRRRSPSQLSSGGPSDRGFHRPRHHGSCPRRCRGPTTTAWPAGSSWPPAPAVATWHGTFTTPSPRNSAICHRHSRRPVPRERQSRSLAASKSSSPRFAIRRRSANSCCSAKSSIAPSITGRSPRMLARRCWRGSRRTPPPPQVLPAAPPAG